MIDNFEYRGAINIQARVNTGEPKRQDTCENRRVVNIQAHIAQKSQKDTDTYEHRRATIIQTHMNTVLTSRAPFCALQSRHRHPPPSTLTQKELTM
eukprot:1143835-Pelagomonas_calceolata.AAC.2